MQESKEDDSNEIVWCDSDPNIRNSGGLIIKHNYKLTTFNDTKECLQYFKSKKDLSQIKAVITSGMRSNAVKYKIHGIDGLNMFDRIKSMYTKAKLSQYPILAVVSAAAVGLDECAERGIKIVASWKVLRIDVRKYVQERVLSILGNFNAERRALRHPFQSKPTASCEENRSKCLTFLTSLLGKDVWYQHFQHYADHCFCSKCENEEVFVRGNPSEKYVLPIGWYRFGIKIREDLEMKQVEKWNVAYHGTPTDRVASIMEHRRIMFPGDKLNNGTILPVRLGAIYADQVCDDGKVIYISPTIKYSGHPIYAKPKNIGNGMIAQVVFQCKVKPGCFKKFPTTLGKQNFDKNISDNEIEWISADRKGVAPYAVLVRIVKV